MSFRRICVTLRNRQHPKAGVKGYLRRFRRKPKETQNAFSNSSHIRHGGRVDNFRSKSLSGVTWFLWPWLLCPTGQKCTEGDMWENLNVLLSYELTWISSYNWLLLKGPYLYLEYTHTHNSETSICLSASTSHPNFSQTMCRKKLNKKYSDSSENINDLFISKIRPRSVQKFPNHLAYFKSCIVEKNGKNKKRSS
jgi:hypothetical protein